MNTSDQLSSVPPEATPPKKPSSRVNKRLSGYAGAIAYAALAMAGCATNTTKPADDPRLKELTAIKEASAPDSLPQRKLRYTVELAKWEAKRLQIQKDYKQSVTDLHDATQLLDTFRQDGTKNQSKEDELRAAEARALQHRDDRAQELKTLDEGKPSIPFELKDSTGKVLRSLATYNGDLDAASDDLNIAQLPAPSAGWSHRIDPAGDIAIIDSTGTPSRLVLKKGKNIAAPAKLDFRVIRETKVGTAQEVTESAPLTLEVKADTLPGDTRFKGTSGDTFRYYTTEKELIAGKSPLVLAKLEVPENMSLAIADVNPLTSAGISYDPVTQRLSLLTGKKIRKNTTVSFTVKMTRLDDDTKSKDTGLKLSIEGPTQPDPVMFEGGAARVNSATVKYPTLGRKADTIVGKIAAQNDVEYSITGVKDSAGKAIAADIFVIKDGKVIIPMSMTTASDTYTLTVLAKHAKFPVMTSTSTLTVTVSPAPVTVPKIAVVGKLVRVFPAAPKNTVLSEITAPPAGVTLTAQLTLEDGTDASSSVRVENNNQVLADVAFTPGRSTLTLTTSNVDGDNKTETVQINVEK
jgi:hypothetical protein